MIFSCPNCNARYRIPEERFKRELMRVKCRNCGLISTVARPKSAEAEARAKSPASPAPVRRPVTAPSAQSVVAKDHTAAPADRKKPRLFEYWYFLKGRERKGPYHFADLDKYCVAGVIHEGTYVWHPTFDGWKKIRDVKILRPLLERRTETPPPPPPVDAPGVVGGKEELMAPLKAAETETEAPRSRQPIHRTENLVNILEQIEQQQKDAGAAPAAAKGAAARAETEDAPFSRLAGTEEAQEKRKIVDLLEKLDKVDRAEPTAEGFKAEDEAFFDDDSHSAARAEDRGEDLNDILKQLAQDAEEEEQRLQREIKQARAEKQEIFADIPDIEIPTKPAAVPTKAERRKMVQEFSMMIRHERKTRKMKLLFAVIGLCLIGGVVWGLKSFSDYDPAHRIRKQANLDKRTGLHRPTYGTRAEKAGSASSKIGDDALDALRRKQLKKEQDAARAAAALAAGNDRRNSAIDDKMELEKPTIARSYDFKIDEKKPEKNGALVAGNTLKAKNGKEELVIGYKSKALEMERKKTFTEESITNTIRKKMKRFNICKRYTVGMDTIEVMLDFTIGTSGTVSRISLRSDRPIPAELAKCLRAEILKWTFPPPDKPRSYTRNLMLD